MIFSSHPLRIALQPEYTANGRCVTTSAARKSVLVLLVLEGPLAFEVRRGVDRRHQIGEDVRNDDGLLGRRRTAVRVRERRVPPAVAVADLAHLVLLLG